MSKLSSFFWNFVMYFVFPINFETLMERMAYKHDLERSMKK